MSTDDPAPWSAFGPETWERVLAFAYIDGDFDPEEIGRDAGLDPAQIGALKAWCTHVEREHEARRLAGVMVPSTIRFLESLRAGASADDKAKIEAEIDAIRSRPAVIK